MRILLTGASGFLGSHILKRLENEEIYTLSRKKPAGSQRHLAVDVVKKINSLPVIDLVIHAAGKAHTTPRTPQEGQAFHEINIEGTKNLLEALSKNDELPKAFVYISSVAVYGLLEGENIPETAPRLAKDPYGISKIKGEDIISDWCEQNGVRLTILRLPILAGVGAPGNLGYMINAINKGLYFGIKGNKARKSIVFADDVAKIIIKAAEVGGVFNLTDKKDITFRELEILISGQLNKKPSFEIPLIVAKTLSFLGDILGNKMPLNSKKLKKIISTLTFDSQRAEKYLFWDPLPVIDNFIIK